MNNCIFHEILERKITGVETDSGSIFNGNTDISFIRGISVVMCIEIWKRFLVQRDMLVRQNPKLFQPVLDFFRTDFKSMNFESEAEKIPSEIF